MSNPNQKHHRQSTRLRTDDYASDGADFITCCTHEKTRLFGEIVNGEVRLNPLGEILLEESHRSSEIRADIRSDAFVIMPNHIQRIVWIERAHGPDTPRDFVPGPAKKSPGSFVAQFKSAVTERINQSGGTPGHPVWQHNYHDRMVRVEQEPEQTRHYLLDNPLKWHLDDEYSSGNTWENARANHEWENRHT